MSARFPAPKPPLRGSPELDEGPADTWVRPYGGPFVKLRRASERGFGSREAGGHVGPPLRRALRQAQESLGEGVWEPGSGRTRGSAPTAGVGEGVGESPSPLRQGLRQAQESLRAGSSTGPSSSSGEPQDRLSPLPKWGKVAVQTSCAIDSFALRQGESPHLNLPPRGEEARASPSNSERLRGRGTVAIRLCGRVGVTGGGERPAGRVFGFPSTVLRTGLGCAPALLGRVAPLRWIPRHSGGSRNPAHDRHSGASRNPAGRGARGNPTQQGRSTPRARPEHRRRAPHDRHSGESRNPAGRGAGCNPTQQGRSTPRARPEHRRRATHDRHSGGSRNPAGRGAGGNPTQ